MFLGISGYPSMNDNAICTKMQQLQRQKPAKPPGVAKTVEVRLISALIWMIIYRYRYKKILQFYANLKFIEYMS